jgi:hypothetical protein
MAGKRAAKKNQSKERANHRNDVEDGRPQKDRKYRFRENNLELDKDDQRRVHFKTLLLESVDKSQYLEDFRRSDDEVRFVHVVS